MHGTYRIKGKDIKGTERGKGYIEGVRYSDILYREGVYSDGRINRKEKGHIFFF